MFFIVGMRNHTKTIGPVEKRVCPNCQREDFWELHQIRNFLTLFFVRVIPYKTRFLIVCPVCHLAHPVAPENLERFRELALKNMKLIKG